MEGLHWTGAALLLAVAVLSGGASRRRQESIVTWDEFAREHRIALDDEPILRAAPLRRAIPRRARECTGGARWSR